MNSRLIILRGNSGSGKTTVAKILQKELGYGTMLVSQDVIRREILDVSDQEGNPAIQLIYDLCMYGNRIGFTVILEGILRNNKYRDMLKQLMRDFKGSKHIYYFDLTYEETLRRHETRTKANEFGEVEMRKWWLDEDYLDISQEILIGPDISEEEIVSMILSGVRNE